jgi:hypothetical protein
VYNVIIGDNKMNNDEIEQLVEPLLKLREEYGIGIGLKHASAELKERAVAAFQNENDNEAKILRSLSNCINLLAERHFDLWRKDSKEKDKAWKMLENALK